MNNLPQIPKSVIFAVAAAIGCFVAAILAEPLFIQAPPRYVPPTAPSPKFCLTFDDSGSMGTAKRAAVKNAAKEFVQKRDLEKEKVAIVAFSSSSRIFLQLSHDQNQVLSTIASYQLGGGTIFSGALQDSASVFQSDSEVADEERKVKEVNEKIREQNEKDKKRRKKIEPLKEQSVPKIVLFFTDGQNGDQQEALQKSMMLRENGIMLFAVATLDGDKNYLGQMTGDPSRVFMTSDQGIADAFKQVEEKIKEVTKSTTLLGESNDTDHIWELTQATVWSALLCFGMAFLIVIVQNRMMRKPLIIYDQIPVLIIGAIAGGFVAGFGGDIAFQVVKFSLIGRVFGWGLLGAVLALGMSFYIRNLDRKCALLGGGLGGVLGAIGFYIFASAIGYMSGRLIGAIILGACIGAMIGLVETYYRNVWLMVVYDPRNFAQVNLGSEKVTVGSGKNDTVFIANTTPQAGTFQAEGNNIRFKNANGTQLLTPGTRVKVGSVELVICSKDVPFSPSKFFPMKMSRAKELQQQNNSK
ncbi:MAG: VWA domain-containing protein [Planctomycetaceae bacterium]|jgi:Ca-activated chloride channel family protein|nr:VWA domain-containing protein [Planctomycetaceae bacterium]